MILIQLVQYLHVLPLKPYVYNKPVVKNHSLFLTCKLALGIQSSVQNVMYVHQTVPTPL